MSAIYRLYYPDSLVSVRYISICNMCVGDKKFLYKHLIANKIVPEQWYKMEELVMNFSNYSNLRHGSWEIWRRTPPKKPLLFLKSLKKRDAKYSDVGTKNKKRPYLGIEDRLNQEDLARLENRLFELQGQQQAQLNIQPELVWQEMPQIPQNGIVFGGEQAQAAPMAIQPDAAEANIIAPRINRFEWARVNQDQAPMINDEPQAYDWNDDENPF